MTTEILLPVYAEELREELDIREAVNRGVRSSYCLTITISLFVSMSLLVSLLLAQSLYLLRDSDFFRFALLLLAMGTPLVGFIVFGCASMCGCFCLSWGLSEEEAEKVAGSINTEQISQDTLTYIRLSLIHSRRHK